MRVLIVADVHSNLAAFEAAIAAAEAGGKIDAIWCLGDLVGYGPQPRACIALLRSYPHSAVAGNHDLAATGAIGVEEFNPYASAAALWTATQLGEDEKAFLNTLPETVTDGDFTLVHGTLMNPLWEYLVSDESASRHLRHQATPYCLVGHSHLPVIFYEGRPGAILQAAQRVELRSDRFVANPGGLGQPRDGDPRAPYAVLDTAAKELSFHRVEYDIRRTQAEMRKAGLPDPLVDRLSRGR